jgi:acetyl-CoA carboxylase biotin carboxyl carrier protein
MSIDSRKTVVKLEAIWTPLDGGNAALTSPRVGMFRPALRVGDTVAAGTILGSIEILGSRYAILAPKTTVGIVAAVAGKGRAQFAVDYRATLYDIDSHASMVAAVVTTRSVPSSGTANTGLTFAAPTSGRFYLRPAPGKPAFVSVGDVVSAGTTVCLLEVMKTFHRVTYGGDGLPERARVVAVVPVEEADVNAGDVLLQLAPE